MDSADGWESLLGYLASGGGTSTGNGGGGVGSPGSHHGLSGNPSHLGAPYASYGSSSNNTTTNNTTTNNNNTIGGSSSSSYYSTAASSAYGSGLGGVGGYSGYSGGGGGAGGSSGSSGYSLTMPSGSAGYSTAHHYSTTGGATHGGAGTTAASSTATAGAAGGCLGEGGLYVTANSSGGSGGGDESSNHLYSVSGGGSSSYGISRDGHHHHQYHHHHHHKQPQQQQQHYSLSDMNNRRSSAGESDCSLGGGGGGSTSGGGGAGLADYAAYYNCTGGNSNNGWSGSTAAAHNNNTIGASSTSSGADGAGGGGGSSPLINGVHEATTTNSTSATNGCGGGGGGGASSSSTGGYGTLAASGLLGLDSNGTGAKGTSSTSNNNSSNTNTDLDIGDLFLRGIESMGDNPSLSMWLMNSMQQHHQQHQQQYQHPSVYSGLSYGNSAYGSNSTSSRQQQQSNLGGTSPNSRKIISSIYNTTLPSTSTTTTGGYGTTSTTATTALKKKSHHSSSSASSSLYNTTSSADYYNALASASSSSNNNNNNPIHKFTATLSSSSNISPNHCSDHASRPATQIDPLLEKLTLTIPAVSLQPLSGSEVVRHIRTKTDDVITRFLPCVDFLVNCQQELRQGLQIANRRRITHHGNRSRTTATMTPRQFFMTYVAPLPKRFEQTNEIIMARNHLRDAKVNLDQLVRDANDAVPQGCEHVKNAFLGGMRENESWGLRKWLSKHGGAGSICNDLEEIMRVVKALQKQEQTTIRLAEMLRPIASQAHDRLKKDVPQAYQEQSSAHPYLPFFHRLEACLKQMATFNPEEDDVICLDDSDDDDDDVVDVVEKVSSSVACAIKSSPANKHNKKNSAAKASTTTTAKAAFPAPAAKGSSSRNKRSQSKREESINGTSIWEELQVQNDRLKRAKNDSTSSSASGDNDDFATFYFGGSNDSNNAGGRGTNRASATNNDDDDSDIEVLEIDDDGNFATASATRPPQASATNAAMALATTAATTTNALGNSGTSTPSATGKWRCPSCSFLNEDFASKCTLCFDNDFADGELAKFLRGSALGEGSNHSFGRMDSLGEDMEDGRSWKALQGADSRELESLAEHISGGGSLPKEARKNVDHYWGEMFPELLRLFRQIILHPTAHRYLEPVNENHLSMMGLPAFKSIVRHPLCLHAIVLALSKSEDAVTCQHLVMRLSNGRLENVGLQHWNMWNGVHLIEAIDLVLLNSMAYNGSESTQERADTEALRKVLWDGVNSMLKGLQPHERRQHLPQKRSPTNSFVVR